MRERVNESHEGKRKVESQQPIMQINWQRSRYVYDMYWKYGKISREVYDYCIRNKLVDGALMAKWRKPGYERLCSTYVINPRNYNFGTVSICRVPKHALGENQIIECPITGCRGCASGTGLKNLFGNKYGQYLAGIQIRRERRAAIAAAEQEAELMATSAKRKQDDIIGLSSKEAIWAAPDEKDAEDDDDDIGGGSTHLSADHLRTTGNIQSSPNKKSRQDELSK
uniref:G10 protein n=1 Tax=Aureoumbra lagunensis TaxID=44058 RepID=A0A7S3NNA3_9STRA